MFSESCRMGMLTESSPESDIRLGNPALIFTFRSKQYYLSFLIMKSITFRAFCQGMLSKSVKKNN